MRQIQRDKIRQPLTQLRGNLPRKRIPRKIQFIGIRAELQSRGNLPRYPHRREPQFLNTILRRIPARNSCEKTDKPNTRISKIPIKISLRIGYRILHSFQASHCIFRNYFHRHSHHNRYDKHQRLDSGITHVVLITNNSEDR